MLLREFMNFDRSQIDNADDNRYLSDNDSDVFKKSDVRKTRLTLKMISEIRRASDAHDVERREELDLIQKMYAVPPAPQPM